MTRQLKLRTERGYEINFELLSEEMAVIQLGSDTRFLEGIILEFVIPEALRRYSDSFGLSVYRDISPEPRTGMKAFTGEKVFFSVLPRSNKAMIKVPLAARGDSGGLLPPGLMGITEVIPPSAFPILVTIQPIMKGVPSSVSRRKFFFTVKEEIAKKGLLNLRIVKPEGFETEETAVFLDDRELFDLADAPLELASGVHELIITSAAFKPATTSFALTPGQVVHLEIALEPNISTLSIESLEGASVYLDGNKIVGSQDGRIQLTEGEHSIRFKLGKYSVSKKFTVVSGRSYGISLLFDIVLDEE